MCVCVEGVKCRRTRTALESWGCAVVSREHGTRGRQLKGRGCKESVKHGMEDYKVLVEKMEDWKAPIEIWEVFNPIIQYIVVVLHPRTKPDQLESRLAREISG